MINQLYLLSSIILVPYNLNFLIFGVDGPKFEKTLAERFQSTEIPRNVNNSLNLPVDNHFKNMSKRYAPTVSQKC